MYRPTYTHISLQLTAEINPSGSKKQPIVFIFSQNYDYRYRLSINTF